MAEAPADVDGAEGSASEPPPGPSGGLGPARITSIVVGVVIAALIVLFALGRDERPSEGSQLLGNRAEAVEGERLDGSGRFDIDDHRGSWVLVNFFATWCPPCVAEHPDLVDLEVWGRERGDLELVSVVFNDPPQRVAEFFAQRGGTWPVIDNPAVPVDWRVAQIPESFLVAPSGRVVLHVEGQLVGDDIKQVVSEG